MSKREELTYDPLWLRFVDLLPHPGTTDTTDLAVRLAETALQWLSEPAQVEAMAREIAAELFRLQLAVFDGAADTINCSALSRAAVRALGGA